jgi:hypothetical protein
MGVVACFAPSTRKPLREHQAIGTPEPEVVDRLNERYPSPRRRQMDSRSEGGIRVVQMDDIRDEALDAFLYCLQDA